MDPAALDALTRLVAEEVDGRLSEERLAAQRRVVAEVAAARGGVAPRRHATRLSLPLLAGAAAAAMLVAIGLASRTAREMPFWVGAETTPRRPGAFLRADGGRSLELRFASGSRLELAPGASARVAAASDRQVRVTLLEGEGRSTVQGQGSRGWVVEAGPYNVAALGTVFTVRWSPGRTALDVNVTRGIVSVEGGDLDRGGVRVGAGQELHAEREGQYVVRMAGGGALTLASSPASPSESPAGSQSAAAGPAAAPASPLPRHVATRAPSSVPTTPAAPAAPDMRPGTEAQPPPASAPAAALRPIPRWKAAHQRGDYPAAVAEAERAGLTELLRTLPADELRQLADAARYAGRGPLARRALLVLRERYPRTGQAHLATFLLGRTSEELLADPAAAAAWFEAYLREDPDGALVEEALGRRIDAYRRAGRERDARAAAHDYLKRHPGGVFAPVARAALR